MTTDNIIQGLEHLKSYSTILYQRSGSIATDLLSILKNMTIYPMNDGLRMKMTLIYDGLVKIHEDCASPILKLATDSLNSIPFVFESIRASYDK